MQSAHLVSGQFWLKHEIGKVICERDLQMEHDTKKNMYWIVGFVIAIWIIELVNFSIGHRLSSWGVLPRTVKGLIGIPLSPFLHSSLSHLVANTIPLAVLGGFIILHGKRLFFEITILITKWF